MGLHTIVHTKPAPHVGQWHSIARVSVPMHQKGKNVQCPKQRAQMFHCHQYNNYWFFKAPPTATPWGTINLVEVGLYPPPPSLE
mmetsp:Transcript_66958/g.107294  ORF Transcript_66958/g.107294 Transcript_66958/m.107294 type:complete len:84 (+) Transcript_66958:1623-1874(+)